MSRLLEHPYQARDNEIQSMRKAMMLKLPKRNEVVVSNILTKTTIIIILSSLVMLVWEINSVTKSERLVKQQSRRRDIYSLGTPISRRGSTSYSAITITKTNSQTQQNLLLYTGSFGIGHRMNKLSCVYHLLLADNDRPEFYKYVTVIKVEWGICPTTNSTREYANVDIFEYLFGSQYIHMTDVQQKRDSSYYRTSLKLSTPKKHVNPGNISATDNHILGRKFLWIRNDVAGYYAGQSYKNARIRLSDRNAYDVFHDKLQSDYHLFRYLIKHRFIGYNHVQQYKLQHEWDKHYVIGIHIRAGNGEKNHFVQSGRNIAISGTDKSIVQRSAMAIHQLYINVKTQQSISLRPPLVFLATDTEHYIGTLTKALQLYNIPVISFKEQPRIPNGMGVSYENSIYTQQSNISCYQSWYGSMVDMTLLSETNTLVATTRSTFTQIIPASMVFHRANTDTNVYRYCEMDLVSRRNNTKITCFQNQTSWLLRNNSREWKTFCINGDAANLKYNDCNDNATTNNDNDPVAHKLMVHFPDIGDRDSRQNTMYTDALTFLKQDASQLTNEESLYFYGRKYNSKYRHRSSKDNTETIQSNWTWE